MSLTDVTFEEFDPNNLPDSVWASYVPGYRRSGKFKLHAKRGVALNACNRERRAKLFEFVEGCWHLRGTWDWEGKLKTQDHCENCGKQFQTTPDRWSYSIERNAPYERVMRRRGKVVWPVSVLLICGECVRALDL